MNKKLRKKIGTAILVSTLVLPSTASLLNNPLKVHALANTEGQNVILTSVEREESIQKELDDFYNHLSEIKEVDYSENLKLKANTLIDEIKLFSDELLVEGTSIDDKKDKLIELWDKFADISYEISDEDLDKMSSNYDIFDNIYFSLYKLTDTVSDLDTKAIIQLTACRSIYYAAVKNDNNPYYNGYGSSFIDYNTIPEIKWSFYTLKEAAATTYRNILLASNKPVDDDSLDESYGPLTEEEYLNALKEYPINSNVGVKDSDVDIPTEDNGNDGGNAIENEKDESKNEDDGLWDKIVDFIEDIINTITGNEDVNNDSNINHDVNYTSYSYENGCYKIVKTYDGNGKLINTQKIKSNSNSDLIYCSVVKESSHKYPDTPNLSSYSVKDKTDYKEETAAIAYTLNKTLPNPQYYKTTIQIENGKISYADTVDLLKQIVTKTNGYYVDDGASTLFMLEGKVFVIDEDMTFNKEKFEEISDKFNYIFAGFISVDEDLENEETSGMTNTLNLDVKSLIVKGTTIDENVYIKNEQFMLPVENVVNAIGGTIEIDKDKNATVTIDKEEFFINNSSNYIFTKDKTYTLLNKNEISGNKLYADLQTVLESLGMKYEFDSSSKTLNIK